VQETVGGVTTNYLVDDQSPTGVPQVMEELVSGVVQRTYTYGHALISQNQASGGARPNNYRFAGEQIHAALATAKESGRNQVALPPNKEMVMKSYYYPASSMRKLRALA